MVSNYTIRSKINVKPHKKKYIFSIIINICLVVVMVAGILKIVSNGLDLGTLGTMISAIVVVTIYKKRLTNKEHYEFALVDATVNDEEVILIYKQIKSYKNCDLKITIRKSTISVLEFSDRLCCLHVCGKINCELLDGKGIVEELNEHFLYLEQGLDKDVIASIQYATPVSIKYMDR